MIFKVIKNSIIAISVFFGALLFAFVICVSGGLAVAVILHFLLDKDLSQLMKVMSLVWGFIGSVFGLVYGIPFSLGVYAMLKNRDACAGRDEQKGD